MSKNKAMISAWHKFKRDNGGGPTFKHVPERSIEIGVLYSDTPILNNHTTLFKVVAIKGRVATLRHFYGDDTYGRTWRVSLGDWYDFWVHPDFVSSKRQLSDKNLRLIDSRIERCRTTIKINNEKKKRYPEMKDFFLVENEVLKQSIKIYEAWKK